MSLLDQSYLYKPSCLPFPPLTFPAVGQMPLPHHISVKDWIIPFYHIRALLGYLINQVSSGTRLR